MFLVALLKYFLALFAHSFGDMDAFPKFKPREGGFDTKAVHSGYRPGYFTDLNAVVPPIILSTSFHIPNIECKREKNEVGN